MPDKGAKEFRKAVYVPGACNYLVAARKSWMFFSMSNNQCIRGYGWRDTYTVDISEPIYVVKEPRLVWCWESSRDLFNIYETRRKVFITA